MAERLMLAYRVVQSSLWLRRWTSCAVRPRLMTVERATLSCVWHTALLGGRAWRSPGVQVVRAGPALGLLVGAEHRSPSGSGVGQEHAGGKAYHCAEILVGTALTFRWGPCDAGCCLFGQAAALTSMPRLRHVRCCLCYAPTYHHHPPPYHPQPPLHQPQAPPS